MACVIALDDFLFKKKIECLREPQLPVTEAPAPPSTPAPTVLWSCDFTQDMCGLITSGEGDWYLLENTNTSQHNHGMLLCVTIIKLKAWKIRDNFHWFYFIEKYRGDYLDMIYDF